MHTRRVCTTGARDTPWNKPIALDRHHAAIDLIGGQRVQQPGYKGGLHRHIQPASTALEFIDRAVQGTQFKLAQIALPPQCGQIIANVGTVAGEIIGKIVRVRKAQRDNPRS